MGRIRTVKPELFKHEELFDLELSTGLPVRIAFAGLFTCCDREGRFKWKPRTLKLEVLPHDELDFSRVLDALATCDFVRKYAIDGEEYGVVPTFFKHQVINNREAQSEIPPPTECSYISITSTRERRVIDACVTPLVQDQEEGKGRERKGKEGEGNSSAQAPNAPQPSDEGSERRRRRRSTEEDMKAARWMFGLVLTVNAAARQPSWEVWADEVRLMREIDGRTHHEICEMFQWAKRDSFWCPNIQSPGKLRSKWDTLVEQKMRSGAAKNVGSWRSSDAATIAKGAEHGIAPRPGESIFTFRDRVQAVIDGDHAPQTRLPPVPTPVPEVPKSTKPAPVRLAGLVKPAPQRKDAA